MSLRVLLVTTWGTACGIAEHSAYLTAAVAQADPEIEIVPRPDGLDPHGLITRPSDLVHLNYHAALHSRWTAEEVRALQDRGVRVVVTYHDTLGEYAPQDLAAVGDHRLDRLVELAEVADAVVVHEPCLGFTDAPTVHVWRMGVADPVSPIQYGRREDVSKLSWKPTTPANSCCFLRWWGQPVLGSIGFPFPWKNYDELARITGAAGWALLLIAPGATAEQIAGWSALNPDLYVRTDFVRHEEALSLLTGCDATAFPYTCSNTGQSGAILQGIAARKPVLALATCRQFRALFEDRLGRTAITWVDDFEQLAFSLTHFTRLERTSPPIVALAEQESWQRVGDRYAHLYRSLA